MLSQCNDREYLGCVISCTTSIESCEQPWLMITDVLSISFKNIYTAMEIVVIHVIAFVRLREQILKI